MPELTVGSTIHYTDNPVTGGGHSRCFEATVTSINPDGTVDIDEHLPSGTTPAYALVEAGKPGDLYTWHWPEGEQETNRLLHYITGGQFL
jgi:hypothetical protein